MKAPMSAPARRAASPVSFGARATLPAPEFLSEVVAVLELELDVALAVSPGASVSSYCAWMIFAADSASA